MNVRLVLPGWDAALDKAFAMSNRALAKDKVGGLYLQQIHVVAGGVLGLPNARLGIQKFLGYFEGCKNLRSVTFQQDLAKLPTRGDKLHMLGIWARLEELSIMCGLEISDCVQILAGCPSLKTVVFGGVTGIYRTPGPHAIQNGITPVAPTTIITHPTLESIYLKPFGCISSFFARLCLPSLRSLSICAVHIIKDRNIDLCPFLIRSSPPIETFSFVRYEITEDELIRCLVHLPSLRKLEIVDAPGPLTDRFVDAMGVPSDESGWIPLPCPSLEEVILPLRTSDGKLSGMVSARWGERARGNGVSCLRNVLVSLHHEEENKRDREVLGRLRREGLDLWMAQVAGSLD